MIPEYFVTHQSNLSVHYNIHLAELEIIVCDTATRARSLLKCSGKSLNQIVVWQNDSDLIQLRLEKCDVPIISFDELLVSI